MSARMLLSPDAQNRLTSQNWQIGTDGFSESYTYNSADGSMSTMTTADGKTITYGYDVLKRLTSASNPVYTRNLVYPVSGNTSSTNITGVNYTGLANSTGYTYTYDASGRITKVTNTDGTYTSYTYDTLDQLSIATNYTASGTATARYKYYYDKSGNLTSWLIEGQNAKTHTYAYTNVWWADLLTIFDGELIAYEGQSYNYSTKTVTGTVKSGNPVCYYNGTRWDMEWSDGRRLALASNENSTIFYTYDLNGIRTSKTVNGVKHEYTYASGRLLRETYGNVVLDFAYDASGSPFSLTYKAGSASAVTYYYITNLQGDVMYLVNSSGTRVASYTYDPYGKVDTATGSMAAINPLRYRGYYYDAETGFYYLQSRYYDPLICRFINADEYASTGQSLSGYNMFTYCNNNPVMGYDPAGYWNWGWKEQAAVGATALIIGLAVLLAVPTGGSSLAFGALVISSSTVAAVGGAMAVTGTIIVGDSLVQASVSYAKKSKKSKKERSTEHPSWVSQSDIDLSKSAQENATELLNARFGAGNWKKGPNTDFNIIVKWINRCLRLMTLVTMDLLMEDS